MKNIILILMFLSQTIMAQETIWRDSDEFKEGITESQWVMFVGAELLRLRPIPTISFDQKYLGERNKTLYGPTIGFARKWYILGNLTTTTEPTLFYLQNDKTEVQSPSDETIKDYHVSEFREVDQYYGIRIAQSLGYTLEFSSFYVEPFVQVYVGQGFGRTKVHFHYDTQIPSEHEEFDSSVHEQITHQGLAAGIQVINRSGYMSFLKASKNTLSYHTRETKSYAAQGSTISESSTDDKIDQELDKFTFTLGLGYIF